MQEISIPQKDKGYNINFAIQYANSVAVNWTGYTVNFKSWSPLNSTVIVNRSCTAINAAAGNFVYTIQSGDFNIVATYYGELEATATGIVESTKTFKIIIPESA